MALHFDAVFETDVTDTAEKPRRPFEGLEIFVVIPHAEDRGRVTKMLELAGAEVNAAKSWPQLAQHGDLTKGVLGSQHLVLFGLDPQPLVGLAFASWLRDHDYANPVVALAGTVGEIDKHLTHRAGIDLVLPFPASAAELVRSLMSELGDQGLAMRVDPPNKHSRDPGFAVEISELMERNFCGECPVQEECVPGRELPKGVQCPGAAFVRSVFDRVAEKTLERSRELAREQAPAG